MGPEFFSLQSLLVTEAEQVVDCMDQYFLATLIDHLSNEENQ